ncbi:MAG: hypothetical protein ACLUR5_11510 [Eubacterium ventriosum]
MTSLVAIGAGLARLTGIRRHSSRCRYWYWQHQKADRCNRKTAEA